MSWLVQIGLSVGLWLLRRMINNWLSGKVSKTEPGRRLLGGAKDCEGALCEIRDSWQKRRQEMRDRRRNRRRRSK